KDALYCDRPDSLRRRAARTVLDHLHRCLTTWLAPVLCFTAEEAWAARFGEAESVHLQLFPALPAEWRDAALGAKWARVRELRRLVTVPIEEARRAGTIRASLEAAVTLGLTEADQSLLDEAGWAEVAIVSAFRTELETGEPLATVSVAPGTKCVRCWRVLEEVGRQPNHPTLCARCADAVDSGLVCRVAA
ncbi:MAG TPA: class I tRNA ligase family protein, partial [Acetobacteraceae bacterium]